MSWRYWTAAAALVALVVAVTACELATRGAAAATGGAVGGSPESVQAARAADRAFVEWLLTLFGGYVGGRTVEAGTKKVVAARRARRARARGGAS